MLSPSRRSSLPPQLALTTLSHAVDSLTRSMESALLEDAERTREAWSKSQADSERARELQREAELQRDQAAQRAAESEDLRAVQTVELQRERERRSAAEATLRIREEAASELRTALRAAEEALRASEEKRQRLEVQCEDSRAALERKTDEKRSLFVELEGALRDVEKLRRLVPADGGLLGASSKGAAATAGSAVGTPAESTLEGSTEALQWAQRVLDVLSSKVPRYVRYAPLPLLSSKVPRYVRYVTRARVSRV